MLEISWLMPLSLLPTSAFPVRLLSSLKWKWSIRNGQDEVTQEINTATNHSCIFHFHASPVWKRKVEPLLHGPGSHSSWDLHWIPFLAPPISLWTYSCPFAGSYPPTGAGHSALWLPLQRLAQAVSSALLAMLRVGSNLALIKCPSLTSFFN